MKGSVGLRNTQLTRDQYATLYNNIQQALDPFLQHRSQLAGGCAPWTPWYSSLIPVFICMSNPRFHLMALTDARLCYGGLIHMFHLNHQIYSAYGTALADAWPFLQHWSQLARGTPPGPPGTHVSSQFSHTCFIPVLVHIFHLLAQHLLMHSCALVQAPCPLHQYSCLIPVMVHIFHLMAQCSLMLSCVLESPYHQYQFRYTYLQVLCRSTIFRVKISQEELQDIQYFWLQDLHVDCPKLS